MKKPYIEYKSSHKGYAKKMRRNMTRAEKKIWFDLLQKRPNGYKFIRQKMIGPYILDFYCSALLLCIEVDGGYHFTLEQQAYDTRRSAYLYEQGIRVVRYTNQQVIGSVYEVGANLAAQMRYLAEKNR